MDVHRIDIPHPKDKPRLIVGNPDLKHGRRLVQDHIRRCWYGTIISILPTLPLNPFDGFLIHNTSLDVDIELAISRPLCCFPLSSIKSLFTQIPLKKPLELIFGVRRFCLISFRTKLDSFGMIRVATTKSQGLPSSESHTGLEFHPTLLIEAISGLIWRSLHKG